MLRKMLPLGLRLRKMRWPRSRGRWADEDCSLPSTAHNSGPRTATMKAAARFATGMPRAASKAIKTAINTGTNLRILQRSGGAMRRKESRRAPRQEGPSIFLAGKHMNYGHAVRAAICVFYLCAIASHAQQAYGAPGQKLGSSDAAIGAGGSVDACQLLTSAEI